LQLSQAAASLFLKQEKSIKELDSINTFAAHLREGYIGERKSNEETFS